MGDGLYLGRQVDYVSGDFGARLEAARAVLADLERELAGILDVDPRRLQEETLTPGRGGVQVLRRDLVWVY